MLQAIYRLGADVVASEMTYYVKINKFTLFIFGIAFITFYSVAKLVLLRL